MSLKKATSLAPYGRTLAHRLRAALARLSLLLAAAGVSA